MILDRDFYLSHLHELEDKEIGKRCLDKIEQVMSKHTVESTDFLDPFERKICRSILNRFDDISYKEYGGLEGAERKIISIFQSYHYFTEEDIDIEAMEIYDYVSDFSHRNFLGSILALGIDRSKLGDILIHEEKTQILVKREISDYLYYNLHKIGRENVKVKIIDLSLLEEIDILYEEKQSTISSLRLDGVIATALNLSRSSSQELIEANRVKVNWEEISKASYTVEEGALISVKGYGRFILYSINGVSRKERIKVTIRLIK